MIVEHEVAQRRYDVAGQGETAGTNAAKQIAAVHRQDDDEVSFVDELTRCLPYRRTCPTRH